MTRRPLAWTAALIVALATAPPATGTTPTAASRSAQVASSAFSTSTFEGEFALPGWRCAGPEGILPEGHSPAGSPCVRTLRRVGDSRVAAPASPMGDLAAMPASRADVAAPTWELKARTEPLRRKGAQISEDPINHELVLFGGMTCHGASCTPTNETWTWDGDGWNEEHPSVSPPARYQGSMTFDPATKKVLLFGGVGCLDDDCTATGALGDTWTWNGTTWTEVVTSTTSPPARYLSAMAGDPASGRTVLFGGCTGSCPAMAGDTWTWDGSWHLVTPAAAPAPRAAPGLAFDAVRRELVLFGGVSPQTVMATLAGEATPAYADTWTWNGTTWTEKHPAASPPGRQAMGMTFDATRGVTVMHGGYADGFPGYIDAYRRDTWLWDGSTWREQTSEVLPPRADISAVAYDANSGSVVLIGGTEFVPLDANCGGCGVIVMNRETWTLDGSGWAKVTSTWPNDRQRGGMAYDPGRRAAVLAGGYCLDEPSFACTDTWTWDGERWTELETASAAPTAPLVYDPQSSRVLSVGLGATRALEDGDWKEVASEGPAYAYPTISQDSTGSPIMFGGIWFGQSGAAAFPRKTYRWDGSGWVELSPATSPPGRELAQMGYDPARQQVVLYGGIGCGAPTPLVACPNTYLNDTWTWDGATWTKRTTTTLPPRLAFGALVGDARSRRALMFGGVAQDDAGLAESSAGATWSWDGSNWTNLQPASAPGNLLNPSTAELPGTVAIFGGQQDNPGRAVSDTWSWAEAPA